MPADEPPFPGMELPTAWDLRLYLATESARNRTSIISYPRAKPAFYTTALTSLFLAPACRYEHSLNVNSHNSAAKPSLVKH